MVELRVSSFFEIVPVLLLVMGLSSWLRVWLDWERVWVRLLGGMDSELLEVIACDDEIGGWDWMTDGIGLAGWLVRVMVGTWLWLSPDWSDGKESMFSDLIKLGSLIRWRVWWNQNKTNKNQWSKVRGLRVLIISQLMKNQIWKDNREFQRMRWIEGFWWWLFLRIYRINQKSPGLEKHWRAWKI